MNYCPHCHAELVAHEGVKEGFFHCNGCGCCFDGETEDVRAGHQTCALTVLSPAATADTVAFENQIRQLKSDSSSLEKEFNESKDAYEKELDRISAAHAKEIEELKAKLADAETAAVVTAGNTANAAAAAKSAAAAPVVTPTPVQSQQPRQPQQGTPTTNR